MARRTYAQAYSGDNVNLSVHHPGALQLLRGEWEFSCRTVLVEVSEILHRLHIESPTSEAVLEVWQVSPYLELLCQGAALDHGYLGLATKDCLKSRMRKNCTSGFVRDSRQTLHSRNIVKGVSRLPT